MAVRSKEPQLSYEHLEQKIKYQENYINQLQHAIAQLNRHRFGRRSESFVNPLQAQLPFMKEEDEVKPEQAEQSISIEKHIRKKKNKKNKQLPTRTIIIPVDDKDKQCACGEQKNVIRYDVSQRINYLPAVYEILEEKREVVACPHQCENSIQTAIAPKRLLPNTAVTEEFLAHLIIAKLDDRQPLYHLEKKFKSRFGLIISRQNMARWMIACANPLMPIFNLLKDHIIDHTIASMDATTLQVLDEPNRDPSTKSYVVCFRGGGKGNEVILYDYNECKHQQYVANWFNGFSGYIHSDADSFFSRIVSQDDVHSVLCNAHARRKFESISKQSKKKGLAYHAMTIYSKLYKIERRAKKEKISASQRYELRQKHSKPILEEFKVWLDQKINLVPQQSPIFKAMRYVIKNWEGLTRYLEDGNLLIDNNHTEREIKPFVIARKNFMFCKSQAGARALCLHFSLLRSAKLHRLDPYKYYVKIMKSIPHCQTIEDYEALLPWNVDIEKVNSQ